MDVMKPELTWIDGVCYRINEIDLKQADNQNARTYHDTDFEFTCPPELSDDDDEKGIEEENGMFKTSFHVAKAYYAYLIGSKGGTKRNIEVETRTKLIIPKQGFFTTSDIIVKGQQKSDVRLARTKILTMVKSVRNRNKPTHFIAIRLQSDEIHSNLLKFKEEVIKNCQITGIDDLFTEPLKFHLTLGVMVICDQFERDEAQTAFESCIENKVKPMLNGVKISLTIAGLDYLNDDPSNVRVLYAKVSSSHDNLFNQIVYKINSELTSQGIMKYERPNWLCHATLIKSEKNTKFNATKILELYSDFYFGKVELNQIGIASMGSTDTVNGYYKVTNSLLL